MFQVDCAVILLMKDDELSKYIKFYGDRLATVAFCKQGQAPPAQCSKKTLLDRIREKINVKEQTKKKTNSSNATRCDRKITVGWLHYERGKGYCQVRTQNGGGH